MYAQFGLTKPVSLLRAVKKRNAEYLSGRYCANKALSLCNIDGFIVRSGVHRNPIWPDNIVGSITHNDELAICTVSEKKHNLAIGVDVESLLTQDSIDEIKKLIVTGNEIELITQHLSLLEAYTIIFSAKESLFKALYPLVGRFFGFDAAEIVEINTEQQYFVICLCSDLNDVFKSEQLITGYYQRFKGNIVTSIIIKNDGRF